MANNINFTISLNAAQAQQALAAFQTQLLQTLNAGAASGANPFAGLNVQVNNAKSQLSGLASAWKQASLLASGAAASMAVSAYKAANSAETAFYAMQSSARATGDSFADLWALVKKYTADGLITEADMSESIRNLKAMGYSIQEVDVLISRLKDQSAFNSGPQFGGDIGEALKRTTEGYRNYNSATSDSIGMTENMSVMFEKYARSINTTADKLTDVDKRIALMKWTLKGTEGAVGDAARLMNTNAGAAIHFSSAVEKLKVTVGGELAPAFTPFIENVLIPMTTLLALGTKGMYEMVKAIKDVGVAFHESKSIDEFTNKLSKLDEERQQRLLPSVEAGRQALGLPVASDTMNPDGSPKLLDYRGARSKARWDTIKQADVLGTIGAPDPASGLPTLVLPQPGGKVVNGPTRSTQGVADTTDAQKAAKKAADDAETNRKQEAVKNMDRVRMEIEVAKGTSDARLTVLKAELATAAQLRAEALAKDPTRAAEMARAASKESLKQLELEYAGRKTVMAKVELAQKQAIAAGDQKAQQEFALQMTTLFAEQNANIEQQREAISKANQGVFEGNKQTVLELRKLYESEMETRLKYQETMFNADNDKQLADLEALHNEKLISETAYIDKVAALTTARLDAEDKRNQERLAYFKKQALAPVDKMDAAELKGKAQELQAGLDANDTARQKIEGERLSKQKLNAVEVAKLRQDLEGQLAEAEGRNFDAKAKQIDAWIEQKRRELANESGDLLKLAESIATAQTKQNKFDQAQQGIGTSNSDYQRLQEELQRRSSQGLITDIDLDRQSLQLKRDQATELRKRLELLKENSNGSTANVQAIKDVEDELANLDAATSATAKSLNENFFNAVERGFQDMFSGAKKPLEALRDVAISVLKEIASMALKYSLQQAFAGSMGGGGGLGGAVMSLFGGFRAAGGDTSGGKAYITGEKGPEVFFPGVSGRVVSNAEMQSALSGMMTSKVASPATSLSASRELAPAAGNTHVSVSPKVVVSAQDVLSAMQELPDSEHWVVGVVQRHGRKIQGAW